MTGITHCEVDPGKVFLPILLQPVIEVLGIISGISFSVGGHAEYSQGVLNLREARQLSLCLRAS